MVHEIAADRTKDFLQHCKNVKGLSSNSISAYEQDLNEFLRFGQRDGQLDDFDGALVLRYLEYLREERCHKQATIRRRLVTLRCLTNWLRKAGHIVQDPFTDLELDLKPPKRLPRPVEWVDVRTMLTAAPSAESKIVPNVTSLPSQEYSVRRSTGLAIRLMITTGVRVGELTRIKLSSISNDGYRIRIHGKGNKERNVYIGNTELRAELQNIKWLATSTPHDCDYLFVNRNRRRLTEQALRRRLRILGQECSLDTRITPHRLRHSAATFLIEEGVDIRFVQRLLGHSSIATTEIYTRVSDTALCEPYAQPTLWERCSPSSHNLEL